MTYTCKGDIHLGTGCGSCSKCLRQQAEEQPAPNSAITPLPCPFCGEPPKWLSKSQAYGTGASGMEPSLRALGCDNLTCGTQPQTRWAPTEIWEQGRGWYKVNHDAVAIRAWNTRAPA